MLPTIPIVMLRQGRLSYILGNSGSTAVVLPKRNLNTGEISTALRPFYFNVHPDLFGQYPEERLVNENSLKLLSGYLETVQKQRVIQPVRLKFFIRPESQGAAVSRSLTLRSVHVTLADTSLRKTVVSLLESCNLPTSHLKPEPAKTKPDLRKLRETISKREAEFYDNHPGFGNHMRDSKEKLEEEDHLKLWLGKHRKSALENQEACIPIKIEIERLKTGLCSELGLRAIKWDSGWNISHFRGALQSFQALLKHYPNAGVSLKGKTLIFGSDTGVNLDGDVMLNCGEVRHNWLDLLKRVEKQEQVLIRLPAFERAVSRVLRDIRVMHRKFQPKVMAEQYESQLRRLTTSLSDYQGRFGYPQQWPMSLQAYQIVVETEAGPLMVSPTGQFIVPSSCPAFLLVNFITDHLVEARNLLDQYETNKDIEDRLVFEVAKVFNLQSLRKDDNITPALMIAFCEKILANSDVLRPLLDSSCLFVTTYYSLLTDGQICVPWNWKL